MTTVCPSFLTNDFYCLVKDDSRLESSLVKKDVGNSVTLRCMSDGPVRWYYEATGPVKWYYDATGKMPRHEPFSHSNPLVKSNLQHRQSGFYYCYGLREDNTGFLSKTELRVYRKLV